jgi:hypothetical protein
MMTRGNAPKLMNPGMGKVKKHKPMKMPAISKGRKPFIAKKR